MSPPYHIVNSLTGKHIGPFTTITDAKLAAYIGSVGWVDGKIMDREEFNVHMRWDDEGKQK